MCNGDFPITGGFQGVIIMIIIPFLRASGKKQLSLQEVLDLLQNMPYESSDALTDDSSDEEVPANDLLEFSLDSLNDYQMTEQDSRCSSLCSENTEFPTRALKTFNQNLI
ncbi:hypothetical protein TNCV_2936791 [Trichonephila clavipes]|nr:hypothetical protein TNCV_2936791 [Trichonephila clavipes]